MMNSNSGNYSLFYFPLTITFTLNSLTANKKMTSQLVRPRLSGSAVPCRLSFFLTGEQKKMGIKFK